MISVSVAERRYLGFYAHHPFWAGTAPSQQKLSEYDDFEAVMAEIVFKRQCDQYEFAVCRDGLILLHINEIYSEIDSFGEDEWIGHIARLLPLCVMCANSMNLLLETAYLSVANALQYTLRSISSTDLARVITQEGKVVSVDFNSRYERGVILFEERKDGLPLPAEHWHLDKRFLRRFELSIGALEVANEWFGRIIGDSWVIWAMQQLVDSATRFKELDYMSSLLLAWFIIESFIKEAHEKLVQAGSVTERKANGYRKTVEECVGELIDYQILNSSCRPILKSLRESRNEIIHKGNLWCTFDESRAAIKMAIDMLFARTGIKLTPGLGHLMRCP